MDNFIFCAVTFSKMRNLKKVVKGNALNGERGYVAFYNYAPLTSRHP